MSKKQQADNEVRSLQLYGKIMNRIVLPLIGNETTYSTDLERAGVKLLGSKFRGVFPSDKIPPLNDLKSYAVLNLDSSNQAGSHWIAVAHDNGKTYVYDSFGRKAVKIIPSLFHSGNGRIINTDPDAEQKIKETNCGARCITWLLFFDRYGAKKALLI
jgi:hypothetical protein